MPGLSSTNRFHFVVSTIAVMLFLSEQAFVSQRADAQFYAFGPRGGVSIQSPFFSLNVPTSPYPYGHGYFDHGYYGPSVALPPIPSYRYYEYRYPRSSSFGYSYRGDGYPYSPGIGSFRYETEVIPFGPGSDPSLSRFRGSEVDPYRYRGNVVHPNEPYSAGRVSMDSDRPMDSDQINDALRLAAEQLRQSLSNRPNDSDIWLDYLDPDAVIDSLDVTKQSDPASLQARLSELADHYDGVADNPELRGVSMTPGFERTRQLLRVWAEVQSNANAEESPSTQLLAEPTEDSVEAGNTLPTPEPEPDPAADATNAPQPKTRRSL